MPHVIVIGGANVDIKGRASGPCLPRTSNPGSVTLSAGGVGRNIAENLARLGHDVSLVTALGDDANAALVRSACARVGVDLSLSWVSGQPTGTYLAVLDETGEMVTAVSDMRAMDGLDPAHLEALSGQLARADMLVADCNLPATCLAWLMSFAGRHGLRLLIEPVSVAKAGKLLGLTRAAPVFAITPNVQQLDALAGGDIARLHALGFANVVLHRGREGAVASDGHQAVAVTPVHSPEIADVTGAGDAAVAGLVCGLLEGLPLAEAARLGQCAAAIKLGSRESVATDLSRERLFRLAQTN